MTVQWETRSRTYRESGSINITNQMREAYALIVDLTILSYVGAPSFSTRSIPEKGFWGFATIFERTTPRELIQVELPRFRLLNVRNDAVAAAYNALALAANSNTQITNIDEAVEALWSRFTEISLAPNLRHREDIIKFKGLPKSQFRFDIYWLPFPGNDQDFPDFNPDAPAGEQDEYFEPIQNTPADPYAGLPAPSNIPGNRDPRDFSDDNLPPAAIIGNLTFEVDSNNAGNFQPRQVDNLEWPGQLAVGTSGTFAAEIDWVDDNGVVTNIAATNFPPLVVRFAQFNANNGDTFVPDPNTLTVP